ncbi:MAG: hypothetical protein P8L85_05065 [Rubripirellula sp.]|nr:hypothetical protein [Rubripirellula sp.]
MTQVDVRTAASLFKQYSLTEIRGQEKMNRSNPRINRRFFIGVASLAALPASIFAQHDSLAQSSFAEEVGRKVTIKQVIFRGKHPVMDNPFLRTRTQVDRLVERAGKLTAAHNIKLMALSDWLKQPIATSE